MTRTYLLAAGLLAVGVVTSATAQSIDFTVDCRQGQTISDALARGDARKPLVVNIRGTCRESVSVTRGNVTLQGDPVVGGGVQSPAANLDAIVILDDTVNVRNLTVTGGNNGIRLQGPFYAGVHQSVVRDASGNGIIVRSGDIAITESTIEGAGAYGLVLARGASARIADSRLLNNHSAGIYAHSSSTVTVGRGAISDNGSHGVTLEGASSGTFNSTTIERNHAAGIAVSAAQATIQGSAIRDNREQGVLAVAGATIGVFGNTVSGNGNTGVSGYLGPTMVLGSNTINANGNSGVICDARCTVQIADDSITGHLQTAISLVRGSTLILTDPLPPLNGDNGWVYLWCGDRESSVDRLDYFNGSVFGCSGFDD